MSASLSDILTTAKNLVTAINAVISSYASISGSNSTVGIATTTVVKAAPGRLCTVVVTTAGSGAGTAYDAAAAGATTRPLFTIPNTTGIYVVNMPTNYGLVIVPGSGQVVAVSWS
jgi:hypothetical protein